MYGLGDREMSASWMDHTPIEGQNYYRIYWTEMVMENFQIRLAPFGLKKKQQV
ncbi:MAG: hypothetical protein IPF46_16135 [Saprospiraceae bacterium]|nr:hypothetical protein [Candidatus Vicinibacter affinis]